LPLSVILVNVVGGDHVTLRSTHTAGQPDALTDPQVAALYD
jgi:hypothetical protein